jgi:hypothetical protein
LASNSAGLRLFAVVLLRNRKLLALRVGMPSNPKNETAANASNACSARI